MTHDERISSYIDNELSAEQEQEFLISLAASDGLRKSFRSELVLKNVLHRDEAMAPRNLRAAVFGAVGLAGAGLTATRADAATQSAATQSAATQSAVTPSASTATHASSGLLKSLFATKINALLTAATISISGLAGFGVHALVSPNQTVPANIRATSGQQTVAPATSTQFTPQVQTSGVSQAADQPQAEQASKVIHQRAVTASHKAPARVNASGSLKTDAGPVNGAAGGGPITVDPPDVKTK